MKLFWDDVWYGGDEHYKVLTLKTKNGNFYALIKIKK